jgi:hypothetical protein
MAVPVAGRATCETAGIAERLAIEEVRLSKVYIRAEGDNTGGVYLGDMNVSAVSGQTRGLLLSPGDRAMFDSVNLYEWWIDAETSGDGVELMGLA